LISFWRKYLDHTQFHLVELGPGKGTLLNDILRTLRRFPDFHKNLKQIDLVEISPKMRHLQKETLKCISLKETTTSSLEIDKAKISDGIPIFWYASVKDLPKGNSEP
jgi:NADH dehydrogenase [ubiquinone] 1 alpha subcomplex assembly factor 7